MKQYLSLLISSIILISGCDKKLPDTWQPANPTDARVLSEAMSEVPVDKLRIIYVQYSGIAEYVKNSKNTFKDTLAIEEAIGRFHSDYGYASSEFATLSEVFKKYLQSKGYTNEEDTRNIVESVTDSKTEISRSKIIDDFQTVADAARMALEKKTK